MTYDRHVRPRWIRLNLMTALSFCLTIPSAAQQSGLPSSSLPPPPASSDDSAWAAQHQKEMAKKLNLQRQQEIKKDTEKLLELATELKQSVDRSNENTLSLDVIRKADQIEKLAKSVKEKMKGP